MDAEENPVGVGNERLVVKVASDWVKSLVVGDWARAVDGAKWNALRAAGDAVVKDCDENVAGAMTVFRAARGLVALVVNRAADCCAVVVRGAIDFFALTAILRPVAEVDFLVFFCALADLFRLDLVCWRFIC